MNHPRKYIPRHAHAGNIGADPYEIELEPIESPAEMPVVEPVLVPEPELVPA